MERNEYGYPILSEYEQELLRELTIQKEQEERLRENERVEDEHVEMWNYA